MMLTYVKQFIKSLSSGKLVMKMKILNHAAQLSLKVSYTERSYLWLWVRRMPPFPPFQALSIKHEKEKKKTLKQRCAIL